MLTQIQYILSSVQIEGHLFFLQNMSIFIGISNAGKVLNPSKPTDGFKSKLTQKGAVRSFAHHNPN